MELIAVCDSKTNTQHLTSRLGGGRLPEKPRTRSPVMSKPSVRSIVS